MPSTAASIDFMGKMVESLGHPTARNVVIFLHGARDTGAGIKVNSLRSIKIADSFLTLEP